VKSYTRRGYQIKNANPETKLIYTFFLFFTMIGLITLALMQVKAIGWSPDAISTYYLGNEESMRMAKSLSSMTFTTHFHSFVMGVVYLTLAHILVATEISASLKKILILGGFFAIGLDLVTPWLVRYVSGGFSALLLVSWVGEWVFFVLAGYFPFYDMWFRKAD
jgi:hypothetical protein